MWYCVANLSPHLMYIINVVLPSSDKRVFDNGKSWLSPVEPCRMCMCTQGTIKCHDVMCHALECAGAHTPPGQCCPVCPGQHLTHSQ